MSEKNNATEHTSSPAPILSFHQGTLLLQNVPNEPTPACFQWDARSRQRRAKAICYNEVIRWLQAKGTPFHDAANKSGRIELDLRLNVDLYPYQREALLAWRRSGLRGVICLPTGSGKSWVALYAMQAAKTSVLIVVPTIDLMLQWYDLVSGAFDTPVGLLGGGHHDVHDITITTYDSAYIYIDRYGDRFGLLIFDEVHHLPTDKNSLIPEMSVAPYRLGLTATFRRADGWHGRLERLVGPLVYELGVKALQGSRLAEYKTVRIPVKLTPQEEKEYRRWRTIYLGYLRKKKIKYRGPDMGAFLKQSAWDPEARRALLARIQARRTIMQAQRKLEMLESLLKLHAGERVLIFAESNDLVYQLSEELLIPAITHHTKSPERKWILDNFRRGVYSILVTSKVLNEGVDIPEANVAIVLSGSASTIEHLQRLGRILRKRENKQAVLYEVVAAGTQETHISYRRRQSDAYQ